MFLENAQFGGYRLKSMIGKGGVAEVWLADQLALDREVALKVLPSELVSGEDADFIDRFKREAQAIGRLDHPGILAVFDYGEADGYLYLVMPYARGGNLRSRVRKKPPNREEIAAIFENILAGAAHAHSHGIIHRDLKPANILLHEDGRAYIGDFGIAKTMDNSATLTQAGLILGSPSYMAPEQFMGRADYRSDLYSLGLILFFMLTGRKLYTGRMPFEIGNRHLNDPIPLPDPQVPPDYEPFLRKALAKKPEDRFQSAQEMLQAFKAMSPRSGQIPTANPRQAPVDSPTSVLPVTPPPPQEARWHREKSGPPAPAPSSQEARWQQEKGAVPPQASQEMRWQQEKNGMPAPGATSQEARWLQEKGGAPAPAPTSQEAQWLKEKGGRPAPAPATDEAHWLRGKGGAPASSTQQISWDQWNEATLIHDLGNEATRMPDRGNEQTRMPDQNDARWLQEKNGGIAPTPNPGPARRDEAYERYSREKAYQAPPVPGQPYPQPPNAMPQRANMPTPDEMRWRQEKGGAPAPAPNTPEARWLREKNGAAPAAYQAPPQPPGNYRTPPPYGQAGLPPAPGQPPLKPVVTRRKQPVWLLVAIGGLVVGIIGVGVALWLSNGSKPNPSPTIQASVPTATSGTGSTTVTSGTGATTVSGTSAATVGGTNAPVRGTTPAVTPGTTQAGLPVITTAGPGTTAGQTAGAGVNGDNRTPQITPGTAPATTQATTAQPTGAVPLSGHAGPVNAVAWSANGLQYLTASDDKTLKIWDAATNKVIKTLDDKAKPINDRVLSAVFSNDGQLVVAGIADKTTRIFSVKDGTSLVSTEGNLPAPAAISPDQTLVPYIGPKTIRTWDLKKNANGPEFPYFDSKVSGLAPTALAFSPDNSTLAVGLNNGRIILYNVASGQPVIVVEPDPNVKNGVRLLAWYSGSSRLVVGREKSFETLAIDLKNKLATPTTVGQALTSPAISLNVSADSKRLAVSSQNGEMQIWSLENNQLLSRLSTGANPVIGLHWSLDDQQITVATGGSRPALNTFPAAQSASRSVKVGLTPQNGTKVTGSSLLTEIAGGSVRVTLDIEGLSPGEHNVHIHAGTCATQGDIKFDLETLRATVDGKATSTTVIKVDYTTLTTGSFYINVHNDPGADTYIASCGEIHV